MEIDKIVPYVAVGSLCILAILPLLHISSDMFAAFLSSVVTYSCTKRVMSDTSLLAKIPKLNPSDMQKES